MFSIETIKQVATGYWSAEDDCFVVDCPLLDKVVGTGVTLEEAHRVFGDMVEDSLSRLQDASLMEHSKTGRPKNLKQSTNIHTPVKHETKELIDEMTRVLGLTQGELMDCAIYAMSKRIKRTMPKLLRVSPPREVIRILAHSSELKADSLFIFKTDDKNSAATLSYMLRWEPNQPLHFRYFDELGVPTDFIGLTREICQVSQARSLSEITLEVKSVPTFAQKTTAADIGWAQRELAYIESQKLLDEPEENGLPPECDCVCLGPIKGWGCAECEACGPAYLQIRAATSRLRPNGVSVPKFAKRYDSFDLTWDNPVETNFPFISITGKFNGKVYSGAISGAPCELLLKGTPKLEDFCNTAHLLQ